MVDKAENFVKGEEFVDAEKTAVKLAGDVARGDILKITGSTSDGTPECQKHTGSTPARFVAIHDGSNGQYAEVLRRGTVKVHLGAGVTNGATVKAKANEIVASNTASSSGICGVALQTGANDDDILIRFDGEMS